MRVDFNSREESHRVVLHRIGEHSEEEKVQFCRQVSDHYGLPLPLMEKIVDRCPIVVKKDLSYKKARLLAMAFKSYGASVSVEKKRDLAPIFLEFTAMEPRRLELESTYLRLSPGGAWQLFGRAKNISAEEMPDIWVMIQVFNEFEELIALEEIPLPIHPLPPGESAPFKAMFEGSLPFRKISIAFKSASGNRLPAGDRRDQREWVEVTVPGLETKEAPLSPLVLQETALPPVEPQPVHTVEHEEERMKEGITEWPFEEVSRVEQESPPIDLDAPMEARDGGQPSDVLIESGTQEEAGRPDWVVEEKGTSELVRSLIQEEEELHLNDTPENPEEEVVRIEPGPSILEQIDQATAEHPRRAEDRRAEEAILHPWIEDFRKAIQTYEQTYPDPFNGWFEQVERAGGFENDHHRLQTLLIYFRFNQTDSPDPALENTRKVYRVALANQSLPVPEELPPLEGTPFFSGEAWRDLLVRAIPRLREVSALILEKKEWDPVDLDRLIRIIPHMSDRNSLRAIRFIHQRIPEVMVDLSRLHVDINENLYRVASRLGVVHPFFDFYQGKDSMGDLKIQSFARSVFHEDPGRIEEPMTRVGSGDALGVCLPTEPRCSLCPFEGFCQRLFPGLDPAEKGLMLRS